MIGFSKKAPVRNFTVGILESESTQKLANISLYVDVEEVIPNAWYKIETYNLQTVTDKTQAELELIVSDNFDEYVSLAKAQMNKEAVENATQIDQTALALTDVYEMLLG